MNVAFLSGPDGSHNPAFPDELKQACLRLVRNQVERTACKKLVFSSVFLGLLRSLSDVLNLFGVKTLGGDILSGDSKTKFGC